MEIRKWWNTLYSEGPKYGYYPLPSKTILIVKQEYEQAAKEIFEGTGIKISSKGERHMGAVIGSERFKKDYVSGKVEKWVQDINDLAVIAKDEPQSAYVSYTKAIAHRWTFLQRTVPNISLMFQPIENAIREKLIPALVGRRLSDTERQLLALPVRYGGLGIMNPVTMADIEYKASIEVTQNLVDIICKQERNFSNYDTEDVNAKIKGVKTWKEDVFKEKQVELFNICDEKLKRNIHLSTEKGSSSWLNVLPIKALGFTLNKQEFKDSICLRYGWKIPNTPNSCQCGVKNCIDHALSCKKGGYVAMRHNQIRDLEAEFMREVCRDVKIEPELLPLDTDILENGITTEKARLDVSGIGVWGSHERTFLDVRVFHPNAPSYQNKQISQLYHAHEREKKRSYNERVLQVEKGSFTPIVISTFGGMGDEANRHHKRIATMISEKRKESYSDVMTYMRTRIRFGLLKSILAALRGVRGKTREETAPLSSLSFNLIGMEKE